MQALRVAEINTDAIKKNVKTVLAKSQGANLIAVVKAGGYGHGAVAVANAALEAGASLIGVTELSEAFELRAGGFTGPVISWLHGAEVDFSEALRAGIEIGVSGGVILENVYAAVRATGVRAVIHLKLDTGLSRGGVAPADFEAVFKRAAELQTIGAITVRGVFSHLANTSPEEDLLQAQNFDAAIAMLAAHGVQPEMLHLASSAAVFTSPHLLYNTVRVGLALYGLSPLNGFTSADLGLHPAMTLKAQIIALRDVEAGAGVSYSYVYRAATGTKLALIPFGYADGMPRLLNATGATVLIRGIRCPIVGRIAMDQCIVDLTPLGFYADQLMLGEEVILFGDPLTGAPGVDEWANSMQTINYEIVARLGQRVVRVVTSDTHEKNV